MDIASTTAALLEIYTFASRGELFWKLFFSFLAGATGSAAYISAVYFNFVTRDEESRDAALRPFQKGYSFNRTMCFKKTLWYTFIGGFIAMIFQYDVPSLVPVQSMILGATWPAVISQFLSGKMVEPVKIPEKSDNPSMKEIQPIDFDF